VIPFALGALIAKVATVAAIPRAVQAFKTFFSGPETRDGTSIAKKAPQPETPSAIPETGTKGIVFTYNALNQPVTPGTHIYDTKGQATNKDGRTFEWDDDGRMTAILDGTHRSEFAYDGYGRRIKIAEFENGTLTSKKLYWWLGGEIVCERDGIDPGFPITKRYFGQGVQVGSNRLYYTFDQLGSVRELIDSTGTVRADYRYSTFGERTKVGGDLDSDW
jgi:YD repeat-containing protein